MAHELAAAGEPKGTRKLYAALWTVSGQPAGSPRARMSAIASSMDMLAQIHDRRITPDTAKGYAASLEEFTQEEIILAFSRAHDELRFFPVPAILREFSGRPVTGDPIAAEAKEALTGILGAMRGPHGPKLKDIPGPVLYGTEDDPKDSSGERTHAPIRGKGTPFPLSRRTEATLVRLGWGDRTAGIALLADHPSLQRQSSSDDDSRFKTNAVRAADEILKRFTDAYREV